MKIRSWISFVRFLKLTACGHGNRTPIHKHIQMLWPSLAHRVHLLLIVLPQNLLTFSIHFIHCSKIIDVVQQNCGFDNCRKEITRITMDLQIFRHSYMYLWMPMFPFYMYRYLHSINISSSILCGFKQISTYILALRDTRRLKPLEALLSYSWNSASRKF